MNPPAPVRAIVVGVMPQKLAQELLSVVAIAHGFSAEEVKGPKKRYSLWWCRFLVAHLLHVTLRYRSRDVGGFLGRNRSWVSHAKKNVSDRCDIEPEFKEDTGRWEAWAEELFKTHNNGYHTKNKTASRRL